MHNPLLAVIFCLALIVCISIAEAINPIFFGILVIYAVLSNHTALIIKAILRVRWILLTLILITVLNEPGKIIVILPFGLVPTYEGIYSAMHHAIRLINLMVVVSLMTLKIKRQDLISAFYQLLKPLSLLKCNPERFSARLCLTLEYVQSPVSITHALTQLADVNKSDTTASTDIKLVYFELSFVQFLLIFIMGLMPFLMMYYQS